MLKQSLNAFKLIQHRFNFDSTSFNTVSRGWQTVLTLLFNKITSVLYRDKMLRPVKFGFVPLNSPMFSEWTSYALPYTSVLESVFGCCLLYIDVLKNDILLLEA